MRLAMGLVLALLIGGCTNISQMQKRYEAGDDSQLGKLMEIAGRPDYPYATRRKAVRALGEIGDPRSVEVLIGLLYEYEQRTTLKQEVLFSLGKIGDRQAVEPIGRMLDFQLNSNSSELRMAAIEVLGQLGGAKSAEILVNAMRYFDLLMLYDEQRVNRGVFSGEEQRFPFATGRGDTTQPWMRGPMMGLSPEERGQTMSMFGTPIEFSQTAFNPTPEEKKLTHEALVRVGEEAVLVIADFLAGQETTASLRRELGEIVEEIRNPGAGGEIETAKSDSVGSATQAVGEEER